MSHWSTTATAAANASMSAAEAGAVVIDCEDRSWEPLADIEDLPDWTPMAEIHEGQMQEVPGTPAPSTPTAPSAPAATRSSVASPPAAASA